MKLKRRPKPPKQPSWPDLDVRKQRPLETNPALGDCVACKKGDHAQCEVDELLFCNCWRQIHEEEF